jgi:16S rRNA (cytosine967-C5)-methyltransferase
LVPGLMKAETQHVQVAASIVVHNVLAKGRSLDSALREAMLERKDWGPAQRAALQDLSFGTLRYYGQLEMMLTLLLHDPLQDERIRFLLLVAMYQLLHGKSAPYAVVDHAVRAAKSLNRRATGLANAVLRNLVRNRGDLLAKTSQVAQAKFSYPQWWIDELQSQYGELSERLLEEGNRHPPMTLRVNRRRIQTAEYLALLRQHQLSARIVWPDAVQLDKPVPVDRLPGFLDGLVSVQDAGAQYAAQLLDVRDGMLVLDACAAPGGKAAHILEMSAVEMLAVDKDADRLNRVAENLKRLGLAAKLLVADAAEAPEWWDGRRYDRILADVPCSGSGVVRRHPDIKWLRRRADIDAFASRQLGILQALWRLLAQDGKLLYTTCSVFHQENEQVVTAFLAQWANSRRLPIPLPDASGGQLLPNDQHDGFYYALLQKTA